jgi:ADP-dependent NAD(P)H-hydrate dehydratase / NAD(P)H-hydrate epimerase
MQRIHPLTPWPLHGVTPTRAIENLAAEQAVHPTLMERAGLSVARLAMAWAPHAQHIWVACGPGNNGGDGLIAALHLHAQGKSVWLTHQRGERMPADALAALKKVEQAGIDIHDQAPPAWDLGIDALLGLGQDRAPQGPIQEHLHLLRNSPSPMLCVDVPTGLMADSGAWTDDSLQPQRTGPLATLSLLTLKPGLFTFHGKDASGEVWLDDLGAHVPDQPPPRAWLLAPPPMVPKAHASHKGSHGQLLVLGGAAGMSGASILAALAALHAGTGKVFLGLLNHSAWSSVQAQYPSLMTMDPEQSARFDGTVVCGCGGGPDIGQHLPPVLSRAKKLVLDADALNAIAHDSALKTLLLRRSVAGLETVLTPHPLEAARLLNRSVDQVQQDRLASAQQLAQDTQCVVVLKGSGTVIAAPEQTPGINPTGHPRLASAGTGDVLAGLLGAIMARGLSASPAAQLAVYHHGWVASHWPDHLAFTAEGLARQLHL